MSELRALRGAGWVPEPANANICRQRWRKLGRILDPERILDGRSHAAVPIAMHLTGSEFRIYYSSRDSHGRASTCWFVVDMKRPKEILDVSRKPVIEPGPPGFFDDSGCLAGCIARVEDSIYMYYTGWNRSYPVPFRNAL